MSALLITNGLIIDGTGGKPYQGHVLIDADRITAVVRADSKDAEALWQKGAEKTIDAAGLAVSPGFIDAHSHFDCAEPGTSVKFGHLKEKRKSRINISTH